MHCKPGMPGREPVTLGAGLAVCRSFVRAQRGYTVPDAVETLQDALEVVVGNILRGQSKV
jgi:hypothetical protein